MRRRGKQTRNVLVKVQGRNGAEPRTAEAYNRDHAAQLGWIPLIAQQDK